MKKNNPKPKCYLKILCHPHCKIFHPVLPTLQASWRHLAAAMEPHLSTTPMASRVPLRSQHKYGPKNDEHGLCLYLNIDQMFPVKSQSRGISLTVYSPPKNFLSLAKCSDVYRGLYTEPGIESKFLCWSP